LLFLITPVVEEGIDAALDERGFGVEGRTVVMIQPAIPEFATAGVHVADAPTEAWITAELDLAGVERTQAAAERAATRSFSQVVVENRAAVALYEHLGYEEAYRYWYRRDPG